MSRLFASRAQGLARSFVFARNYVRITDPFGTRLHVIAPHMPRTHATGSGTEVRRTLP